MITSLVVLTLVALQDRAFWPVTVTGWVTLVASVGTLIVIPVTYGKWLEKMNGMGGRVKRIEDKQEQHEGADGERRLEIDRVFNEHKDILRVVGESKRSAEQCREDAAEHALRLGAQVAETLQAVNTMNLTVSQRLTALETEVRLRGRE